MKQAHSMVTGLVFHEHMTNLLAQAFNPTGPENLKASLSLKFQGLFDAEYRAKGFACRTVSHECSWRNPGSVSPDTVDGGWRNAGSGGIYQCVYGHDWCSSLTHEGAHRCAAEPECFWSVPNPFYGEGVATCQYHKEPAVQVNGQSTEAQDPWWDRTKLPKPECSNAAQCRLLNTEHELNVASTLERMNSPGVPDAYDRAVTKSLGWLHAHDQAAKGRAQTSRYDASVDQLDPPGVCKL